MRSSRRRRAADLARRVRARVLPTPSEANDRWADDLSRRAGGAAGTPAGREHGREHGRATYVGEVFDAAVERVRERMLPVGVDPDYDLAYEHFDLPGFLLQVPSFLGPDRGDPLLNFLRNGAEARARPEARFSMRAYLARHPDVVDGPERSPYLHWLKRGSAQGELADPAPGLEAAAGALEMPPAELAERLGEQRADLHDRLLHGTLGEMIAHAERIEPLVAEAWPEAMRPRLAPFLSATAIGQATAIRQAQASASNRPARVVMVLSDPRWGGGRRMEGHLAHALAHTIDPAEIVVLYTEAGGRAPEGRFPAGVREVDFATAAGELATEPGAAEAALVALICSFGAETLVSVNSMTLYRAMATYGEELCASIRVFPVLFGNEQLARGNWVGIALRHFYRFFDHVSGVLTDSEHLRDWLCERNRLSGPLAERIHVLRAPVEPRFELVDRPGREGRPRIYWAGRWDRQKRVDLALAIARALPEADFWLWGEAVLGPGHEHELPANVTVRPPFAHVSELDLTSADAWLYTSGWDGVPSILLEIGMTGVPIVASLVGGTGEVLDPEHAWPVEPVDDVAAYVRALREVLADPEAARGRAAGLRTTLLADRDATEFAARATALLLPGEPRDD